MKYKVFPYCFYGLVALMLIPTTQAKNYGLKLEAPVVIVPVIKHPFGQREAKITPQEYPLAQQLRPLLKTQNYAQALIVLTQYKEDKSPALLLLMAQLYLQNKQYQLAEKQYLLALEQMPDLIRAHQGLASLYQLVDNNHKARTSLAKAISLGASQALLYSQLGYLNMQLGDAHAAIAAYQQALMLEPDDDQNKRALLYALSQGKQLAAADHLLDTLLEQAPSDARLWLQRAFIAMEQGNTESALTSAEVAIRLGDKTTGAKQLAAQLHLKQGNFQRAVALSKALFLKSELKFSEVDKLVHYLKRAEQWDFVKQLLSAMDKRKRTLTHSELSRFYLYQGYYSNSRQHYTQASKWLKKAVEADGSNGLAILALAKAKTREGSLSHAELLYQRAERLEAVKLQAMLARAQLYIDQQDYDSALQLLQTVHKNYPQQANIARNIQSLKNLVNNSLSS